MRVIDLELGETLQAASDEDLAKLVSKRLRQLGEEIDDHEARKLVAERAYEATDS